MAEKTLGTKHLFLAMGVVLALNVGGADAAVLTFADRASWRAAAGGVADLFENFDAAPNQTPYALAGGVNFGFLNISTVGTTGDTSWQIDGLPVPVFTVIPDVNGTGFVTTLPSNRNTVFTFEPVRALGFDFGPHAGGGGSGTATGVVTSLGDSAAYGVSAGAGFFGILYDAGETFTTFATTGGAWRGLDNFEAFSATVPIPATLLLMGSAVVGLAGMARARRAA